MADARGVQGIGEIGRGIHVMAEDGDGFVTVGAQVGYHLSDHSRLVRKVDGVASRQHVGVERGLHGGMAEVATPDGGGSGGQDVGGIAVRNLRQVDSHRTGQAFRRRDALRADTDHAGQVRVDALVQVAQEEQASLAPHPGN